MPALQKDCLPGDVLPALQGAGVQAVLAIVVDFCARHDDHWVVLDHVGKPCIRDWGRNSELFDRALELFGPQRIVFGSGWPVCLLAASYEAVHGLAQQWADTRLSASEQDAFWSGNALRYYDLKLATPH